MAILSCYMTVLFVPEEFFYVMQARYYLATDLKTSEMGVTLFKKQIIASFSFDCSITRTKHLNRVIFNIKQKNIF